MGDIKRVESDTKHAESNMSTATIGHNRPPKPIAEESRDKLEAIVKRYHNGSGDTWTSARDRAAIKIGLDRSYAQRLWQRWQSMSDVSGKAYRTISIAYDALCQRVEDQAEHDRSVRREIEHATNSRTDDDDI